MPYFTLTDTSEVEVAWFVARPEMDWMALVFRDGPTAPWKAVLRFRYIVDEKDPWESADRKSGYQIVQDATDASKQKLVSVMDQAATLMAVGGGRLTRLEVKGRADTFMRLWAQQPFAHARVQTPEPNHPQ